MLDKEAQEVNIGIVKALTKALKVLLHVPGASKDVEETRKKLAEATSKLKPQS